MPTTQNQEFAFGDTTMDDCVCPARAAGFDVLTDPVLEVAELYDSQALTYTGRDEGTFGVDDAIHCWEEALKQARNDEHIPSLTITEGEQVLSYLKSQK